MKFWQDETSSEPVFKVIASLLQSLLSNLIKKKQKTHL